MDAIIVCLSEEDKAIDSLNKELYRIDTARHQQFVKMDNAMAGGTKYPSLTTYQACFNHLIPEQIITPFLRTNDMWEHNPKPVLILDYEFDNQAQMVFHDGENWITQLYGKDYGYY